MKSLRIALITALVGSISAPTWAGDLRDTATAAAERAADQQIPSPLKPAGSPALKWSGAALFAGGMGVGLYGFINDKNGKFSEFGEAHSSNKHLGAAGLSTAFAGGVLMLLGTHAKHAPAISTTADAVTVSKSMTW